MARDARDGGGPQSSLWPGPMPGTRRQGRAASGGGEVSGSLTSPLSVTTRGAGAESGARAPVDHETTREQTPVLAVGDVQRLEPLAGGRDARDVEARRWSQASTHCPSNTVISFAVTASSITV